ncbi:MBL fold metallo-hydrolase [Bacillus sp. BGMRC 2118]|nr:MBL fold metallo-hydrolase [Bacillus sp. BGMRC 2118]
MDRSEKAWRIDFVKNLVNCKHFRIEQIGEGVYAALAKEGTGAVANAGFVDLGDKTLVFDTFNTQQAAKELKEIAEQTTGKKVSWVVNSHWHGDHIRGNQIFKDCSIISSEKTYDKMREIHPSRIQKQKDDIANLHKYIQSLEKQYKNENNENESLHKQILFLKEIALSLPTLEVTLPNYTYNDEFTFYGEKRTAKLITLGGGHSICDSFLYIPEEKVAFMGDLLFVETHPTLFEGDSSVEKWIEILTKVDCFEIKIFIPGHGPIGSKQDIQSLLHYFYDIKNSNDNDIPDRYKAWSGAKVFEQNMKLIRKLNK